MTDHGYFEELITAGLDGELSEDEARELRAHLESCERCRNFRSAMEAVYGLADRDLPEAPGELKENVMAAVRAAAPKKKKGRIIAFPLRSVAVAAAAALVLWAGVRVFSPKGSSGSAAAPMTAASSAACADTAPAEDGGELRTAGSGEAAFDSVNGLMMAAPAAPEAAEAEEAAPVPQPDEYRMAASYVVYDAAGEELLVLSEDDLPEGLLTPDKPFPVPNREPDYTVQTDVTEGEDRIWLMWEESGTMLIQTPEGDTGWTVSAQVFRELLNK